MSTIDLSFGDLVDETCERAGLDPAALTHRHLGSITRSLQLLFSDVENKGAVPEVRTDTLTVALPASYGAVQLPADTVDVTQVAVMVDGAPYPLGRSHREDFQTLSFPTSAGNPAIYWLSKSQPDEAMFLTQAMGADYTPSLNFSDPRNTQNFMMYPAWPVGGPSLVAGSGPYLVLWPMNGLGATSLTVTRVRQFRMPDGMGEQLDVGRSWAETIVRGLAAAIAEKYNPEIYPRLELKYREALLNRDADEDHHPISIGYRGHGWGRRRRH